MTVITIDETRLANIETLFKGSHDPNDDRMCIMEAVAFVTHKTWTDHPPCVCPILGAFMRIWNDALPNDEERTTLLKPFIPKLINTRGSAALEQRRATMAADWLIRVHTPAWLRLAKLDKQADLLASLPEITDFAQCPSLMPTLEAVRTDVATARAAGAAGAVWDAAWAAAEAAAEATAQAAAWAAAEAAGEAAGAVWDAAWDAARAAARAALANTRKELQASAIQLVERMIAASDNAAAKGAKEEGQ